MCIFTQMHIEYAEQQKYIQYKLVCCVQDELAKGANNSLDALSVHSLQIYLEESKKTKRPAATLA